MSLEPETLRRRFQKLHNSAIPFQNVGYRSVSLEYASSKEILSGNGGRTHDGRWNPKGLATVYMSLTPLVAMAETLAHYNHYQIPIQSAMPKLFVAITCKLSSVLDLRNVSILRKLQVSKKILVKSDWRKIVQAGDIPTSQLIAKLAYEADFEGLVVNSASYARGTNLVVFPENLKSGSELLVDNGKKLPKNEGRSFLSNYGKASLKKQRGR